MRNKVLSILLSVMLVFSMVPMGMISTSAAETAVYTVAGDVNLTGVAWDPTQNPMTQGDYTIKGQQYDYEIIFEDVVAGSYSFKVTDGTWANSWGKGDNNYGITLSDTCSVAIFFNSETKDITVDAE